MIDPNILFEEQSLEEMKGYLKSLSKKFAERNPMGHTLQSINRRTEKLKKDLADDTASYIASVKKKTAEKLKKLKSKKPISDPAEYLRSLKTKK